MLACFAAAASLAPANEAPAIKATNPPAPVRDALGKGSYPWYDAKTDAVKPLWPPREWDFQWLDRWLRRLAWVGSPRPARWSPSRWRWPPWRSFSSFC